MSFDVKGRAPRSKAGEYFGLNVWDWRPLADYVAQIAPELMRKSVGEDGQPPSAAYVKYLNDCQPFGGGKEYGWHTNDSFGLGDADARALGEILQAEFDSNRAEVYARKFAGDIELMPDVECDACDGTGEREVTPALLASERAFGARPRSPAGKIVCNACSGRGVRRPPHAYYRFHADHVRRFAAFLRDCGGFEIR